MGKETGKWGWDDGRASRQADLGGSHDLVCRVVTIKYELPPTRDRGRNEGGGCEDIIFIRSQKVTQES